MPSPKEEYLAVLVEKQGFVQSLLQGGAMVVAGGAEGMKEAATQHPEVIIAAIAGLSAVVESMWTEHLALVEDYFDLMDQVTPTTI